MEEHVVLVDDDNAVLGTAPKATVHTHDTPLHRAFSFFLLTKDGQFLISQRAKSKKTWPGVWTNTCCGHPALDEPTEDAVLRRLKFEMGIELEDIHEILPDFSYKATREGVMENELCPVWATVVMDASSVSMDLNPEEVEAVKWISWREFISALKDPENDQFDHFSVWSKEEALLLDSSEKFNSLFNV